MISRENDEDWYEACNPLIPSARGLVPVAFFEVIGKNERQSAGSARSVAEKQEDHDSGFSEAGGAARIMHNRSEPTNTTKAGAHARMSSIGKGSGAMVYGVVKYDFHAERPDELEAVKDDPIIIIAQSNPEWFVAKPIGRLGGPGLIPVAWVQLKDMTTGKPVGDPHEAVQRAGVPKVEEWKKMAADYKNSSISLGRLDSSQPLADGVARMSMSNGGSQHSVQTNNRHVSVRGDNEEAQADSVGRVNRSTIRNQATGQPPSRGNRIGNPINRRSHSCVLCQPPCRGTVSTTTCTGI